MVIGRGSFVSLNKLAFCRIVIARHILTIRTLRKASFVILINSILMLLLLCRNGFRGWSRPDMIAEEAGQFGLKAEQIDKIRRVFADFSSV